MKNITIYVQRLVILLTSFVLFSGNALAYHDGHGGGGDTGPVQYALVGVTVSIIVLYVYLKFYR